MQRGGTVLCILHCFHSEGVPVLHLVDPPGAALPPSREWSRYVHSRRLLRCSIPSAQYPLLPNRVCGELLPCAEVRSTPTPDIQTKRDGVSAVLRGRFLRGAVAAATEEVSALCVSGNFAVIFPVC